MDVALKIDRINALERLEQKAVFRYRKADDAPETRGFGYVWRLDEEALMVFLTPSKLDLRKREANPDHKPARLFTFNVLRIVDGLGIR